MCNYLAYNIQQQNSLNLTSNNLEIEEKSTTGSFALYIQGVPGGMDKTSGECSLG